MVQPGTNRKSHLQKSHLQKLKPLLQGTEIATRRPKITKVRNTPLQLSQCIAEEFVSLMLAMSNNDIYHICKCTKHDN